VYFGPRDSAFSEALQERQELVPGPIAAWPALERIGFGQRLLFEREIRMEINLNNPIPFIPSKLFSFRIDILVTV
jgi:hypothetical protein